MPCFANQASCTNPLTALTYLWHLISSCIASIRPYGPKIKHIVIVFLACGDVASDFWNGINLLFMEDGFGYGILTLFLVWYPGFFLQERNF